MDSVAEVCATHTIEAACSKRVARRGVAAGTPHDFRVRPAILRTRINEVGKFWARVALLPTRTRHLSAGFDLFRDRLKLRRPDFPHDV